MSLKLGFVGLGNMGEPMAAHLAKYAAENGASLTVWNRTQTKYAALKEKIAPATFVLEVEELAAHADIIFVSVLNDAAAADVVQRIGGAGGKIIVDHSSVSPKASSKYEARKERERRVNSGGVRETERGRGREIGRDGARATEWDERYFPRD